MPAHASAHPESQSPGVTATDGDAEETALKHLKTYLASAEALLAHIDGSHSPVMITTTDIGGDGPQILYANQAFRDMLGYGLGELLGDTLSLFHGPDTDPDDVKAMRQELLRTGFAKTELARYRKNGDSFLSYVTASRMRDEAPGQGVFLFVENEVPTRAI